MKGISGLFATGLVFLVLSSCEKDPLDLTPGRVKILILGNSIVHHGPSENIGWKGDWGMAASAREKDFLHVLMRTLSKHNPYKSITYKANRIASWEQNFQHDFANDTLRFFKPDILIIRLGENVPEDYARTNDFESALAALAETFKAEHTHTIITGNFWPSTYKDNVAKKVAENNGYAYVDLTDLQQDDSNKALTEFNNWAVAQHPSDTGMKKIAMKIYMRIIEEKWF